MTSFGGDEKVGGYIVELMVAQLCEYTKSHLIVYFKRVNFMMCELYLIKKYISL